MVIVVKKASEREREREMGHAKSGRGGGSFLKRYDGHGRPLSKDPVGVRGGFLVWLCSEHSGSGNSRVRL